MDREEYRRCCESPAYFFNHYALVKNERGEWVKPEQLTDERLDEAANKAREELRRQKDLLRRGMVISLMELFPDVFKGKVVLSASIK